MAADRAGSDERFHAMGSEAHVIVVGGPAGLAARARDRIADLERRWSRFLDHSEVSALNRAGGAPVMVSADTAELVRRAISAWRLTGGVFDPTVLGAVIRSGYDRSFEQLGPTTVAGESLLASGADRIEILDDIVRLPAGIGFDPGGVGKGLAADIVAEELREAGALGVCVNLGGDVRVSGVNPHGGAWTIAVDHPQCADPITRLGVTDGAAATSTTLRRRWHVGGETRHHLIDPKTGRPSTSDLTFVTVVAGYAWAAEVLAKAVLLRGTPNHFAVLEGTGAQALAIDEHGDVDTTPGMAEYLADPDLRRLILPDAAPLAVVASMSGNFPWYVAARRGSSAGVSSRPRRCGGSRSRPRSSASGRDRTGSSTCTAGSAVSRSCSRACTCPRCSSTSTPTSASAPCSFPSPRSGTRSPSRGVWSGSTCCSRWS